MSRHRDVRNLDYDEEYDEAYSESVYGHSVDDYEYGVSPSVEQYMYSQRGDNYGFGAYFNDNENIKEEEEDNDQVVEEKKRRDSLNYERQRLSSEEEVRVNSILDEIRNVVGEQYSESELIRTVIANNYHFEKSLDALLNQSRPTAPSSKQSETTTPVPQPKQKSSRTGKKGAATSIVASTAPIPIVVTTPARSVVKGFVPQQNGVSESGVNKDDTFGEPDPLVQAPPEKDIASIPRLPVRLRDKEIDVEAKYRELRGGGKDLLNLVVIGHVDAGKSTLMGHLLYLQGIVPQRTLHKYEQESKKLGKQSFMYAWVLDDTDEERSRGITVDVAQRIFETDSKVVTLLDAPGHRDFIPNMITGAARADVAVLVVDASTGEFEAGFESGGQTREHAILIRSLGLSQLAVAVNKLDTVDWSQARFEEVSNSLRHFLKTVGFRDSDVTYVPCSGLSGDNLINDSPELIKWYNGPTLLQAIDKLKVPERNIVKPIRFCISDLYKGQGSSMCVAGRLETGYVQSADRLMLMPLGEIVSVKGVQAETGDGGCAFAGDHVTLTLTGIDPYVLHVGDFLCEPHHPIPQATRIQARVVIFNISVPLIKGSQLDFHYQSVTEAVKIRKLVSILHKSTGQVVKQRPRALTKNISAVIELEFSRPLCLEIYKDCKELGRFMLRNNGVTVAAGMVSQILG